MKCVKQRENNMSWLKTILKYGTSAAIGAGGMYAYLPGAEKIASEPTKTTIELVKEKVCPELPEPKVCPQLECDYSAYETEITSLDKQVSDLQKLLEKVEEPIECPAQVKCPAVVPVLCDKCVEPVKCPILKPLPVEKESTTVQLKKAPGCYVNWDTGDMSGFTDKRKSLKCTFDHVKRIVTTEFWTQKPQMFKRVTKP